MESTHKFNKADGEHPSASIHSFLLEERAAETYIVSTNGWLADPRVISQVVINRSFSNPQDTYGAYFPGYLFAPPSLMEQKRLPGYDTAHLKLNLLLGAWSLELVA